jgi:predicted RNA polymerase sigma factor
LIDLRRSEQSRRKRELASVRELQAPEVPDQDDTLLVLLMCCRPALTSASAIALTLRAVGGLTTAEIARAFLVSEATMAQRIARAKQRIKASHAPFAMPGPEEHPARVRTVLRVLYLIFNEGYASSAGAEVHRAELAGELIPLAQQDRTLWDQARVAEGVALLDGAAGKRPVGEYRLQAAIAAVHDQAARAEHTDWPQILGLYGLLEQVTGNPVVTLNRAVAAAMAEGPAAGLAVVDTVEEQLAGHYRVDAVRGYLLEMAGETDAAVEHYRAAARRTTSLPERRHLITQAARLRAASGTMNA